MSSEQRDTLYRYLHAKLGRGGLMVEQVGGSNELARYVGKHLIRRLLHVPGITPRCGKGVVAVLNCLFLSVFYATLYKKTKTIVCYPYSIPSRGGPIDMNDMLFNDARAQACGLRSILLTMSKAKIFVALVLGEINKDIDANGWVDFLAKRVGGSTQVGYANHMQLLHGCQIVPQAVDDLGPMWKFANYNELELSKQCKLTIVLDPMCTHEDCIAGCQRNFCEAKLCFVVPAMCNGNMLFPGRGGNSAEKFVIAREFSNCCMTNV
jgi:hypothetical protein